LHNCEKGFLAHGRQCGSLPYFSDCEVTIILHMIIIDLGWNLCYFFRLTKLWSQLLYYSETMGAISSWDEISEWMLHANNKKEKSGNKCCNVKLIFRLKVNFSKQHDEQNKCCACWYFLLLKVGFADFTRS
jgi:hypothetical protein